MLWGLAHLQGFHRVDTLGHPCQSRLAPCLEGPQKLMLGNSQLCLYHHIPNSTQDTDKDTKKSQPSRKPHWESHCSQGCQDG